MWSRTSTEFQIFIFSTLILTNFSIECFEENRHVLIAWAADVGPVSPDALADGRAFFSAL
jgi:hypothetical protein